MTPDALPHPAQLACWLAAVYGVASIICFTAYALDKSAAIGKRRRTPERTLLLLGLACGWPGGWLAQRWLRHKTVKPSFQVAYWASVGGQHRRRRRPAVAAHTRLRTPIMWHGVLCGLLAGAMWGMVFIVPSC